MFVRSKQRGCMKFNEPVKLLSTHVHHRTLSCSSVKDTFPRTYMIHAYDGKYDF